MSRFEQAVASIAPWAGSTADHAPPFDAGVLSPGESDIANAYQKWTFADVLASLGLAAVSGVVFGVSSLAICVPMHAKWYWPVGIGLTAFTLTWAIKAYDFTFGDSMLISEHKRERRPEPAPIEVKPPAVNLQFDEHDDRGKIKRQVRATLSAPASNHDGLWRYCRELAADRAFPSLEGGKSGPGAQAFGYSPSEFDAWRKEAQRAGLLKAPRAKNQKWEITDRGYGAFARIGQQKVREASYGIA